MADFLSVRIEIAYKQQHQLLLSALEESFRDAGPGGQGGVTSTAGLRNAVVTGKTRSNQEASKERTAELSRQLTMLRRQQDQLLNMRLLEEIDQDTFAAKATELRDRIAQLTVEVDVCDRGRAESGEIALAAFELSQTLRERNGLRPIIALNERSLKSSL